MAIAHGIVGLNWAYRIKFTALAYPWFLFELINEFILSWNLPCGSGKTSLNNDIQHIIANHPPCNLRLSQGRMVGKFGYGLGLKRNSPYTNPISGIIVWTLNLVTDPRICSSTWLFRPLRSKPSPWRLHPSFRFYKKDRNRLVQDYSQGGSIRITPPRISWPEYFERK